MQAPSLSLRSQAVRASAPAARRSPRLLATRQEFVDASACAVDEDWLKAWRNGDGFDAFPDQLIACPLPAGHRLLTMPYSLSNRSSTVDSTVFDEQADALVTVMMNPPATMSRRSLAQRPRIDNYSNATIADRQRAASEFVGFAANVLNLPATMEHVMDPIVLAKFGGWHKKKGTQVLTLKKIMTHLAELAPFVNSKHCPRVSKTYGNAHMAQLDSWLTNIIRKLQSQATALRHEAATNTNGLTLSTMWEHVDSAWIELDKEVELHGWTYDNVFRLQHTTLKAIMTSRDQPALRQGMLRSLHTSMSAEDQSSPCSFEGCKRAQCSKNRIRYIDDGDGQVSMVIECVHYKYSKIKGPQVIHLAPELSRRLATLDSVMREHLPDSTTLFCQRRKRTPYTVPGFNKLINTQLLRFGDKKVPAFKGRRMFIQAFRDFLSHPSTFTAEYERNMQQAIEAAARMMLNTPGVWDHYDDMVEDRSMRLALHLWPRFELFVRERDTKGAKRRYIDVDTYMRKRQRND